MEITKDFLEKEYIEKKRSARNIAHQLNINTYQMNKIMTDLDIPIRSNNKNITNFGLTKEILYNEYIINNKSTIQISQEYNCAPNTIQRKLRGFKIPIRTQSENKIINITGNKFGKFIVLERVENTKTGQTQWLCQCECGNIRKISQNSLMFASRTQCKKCYWQNKAVFNQGISQLYWQKVIKGAIKRNLNIEITKEQCWDLYLKQNRKCALTGLEINFAETSKEHNNGFTTASLDRIDSLKGYTLNNIQWVHKDINKMKNSISMENFIKYCQLVNQHCSH